MYLYNIIYLSIPVGELESELPSERGQANVYNGADHGHLLSLREYRHARQIWALGGALRATSLHRMPASWASRVKNSSARAVILSLAKCGGVQCDRAVQCAANDRPDLRTASRLHNTISIYIYIYVYIYIYIYISFGPS